MVDKEFRELMDERLKTLGWSKSELARAMGRTPQYVGDYLLGRHKPGAELMDKFFEAVGLEVHLKVKPIRKKLVESA